MFSNKPFIYSILFSLVISIFSGFLWMDRNNKSLKIEQQESLIVDLENKYKLEKKHSESLEVLLQAANDSTISTRDKIDERRKDKTTVLKGLDDVKKDSSVSSHPLDADIKRMLDEVCRSVSSENVCPNP